MCIYILYSNVLLFILQNTMTMYLCMIVLRCTFNEMFGRGVEFGTKIDSQTSEFLHISGGQRASFLI